MSGFIVFLDFKCRQIFFGNRLTFLSLPFFGSFFGQAKKGQRNMYFKTKKVTIDLGKQKK
jgi:hypothetical protein